MSRSYLFLLVVLPVMAGLIWLSHRYLYRQLAVATALPAPARRVVAVVLALLGLSLPVGMAVSRLAPAPWLRYWAIGSFVWMGLVLLLLLALGTQQALRQGHAWWRARQGTPLAEERRAFLARAFGGVASAGALLMGGAAMHNALGRPARKDVEVPIAGLGHHPDGLRIVQVSDLHVGPTIRREWVQQLVDDINATHADLLVLTGDLVDGSVETLREHVAPFAGVKTRLGSFLVTGNHEYLSDAVPWVAHWESLGVRVLRNESVALAKDGIQIELAGVDDWSAERFAVPGHQHDLKKALASRTDPGRPTVLLAHQPKSIAEAGEAGVALQLSGHTHGGQIWPFNFLVTLVQPYLAGLYQHSPKTWIYVSRGTGFWGPPMRLQAPSELTVLTLRDAKATAA